MDRFPRIVTLFVSASLCTGVFLTGACNDQKRERKSEAAIKLPASAAKKDVREELHTAVIPAAVTPQVEAVIPEPIVEPEPKNFAERMNRGRELYKAGEFGGALTYFQEAAKERPNSAQAHLQLGRAHLELGDADLAREEIERALEIDETSTFAWNTLGRVELAAKHGDAAIEAFERAIEEDEDNSYAWNNLGFIYIEREDFEAAADAMEHATSGGTPTAYMWNNLGMAYEHLDRIVEARAAYRQAVEGGSDKAQANFDRLEGVISLRPAQDQVEATEDLGLEIE